MSGEKMGEGASGTLRQAQGALSSSKGGMDRREFLRVGGAGAVLAGTGCAANVALTSGAQAKAAARPDILRVITDQQHIDTIAAAGCRHVRTPAFDGLRSRGTSFSLSYTANPVCSPARSSIFTGRATSETGVYVNNKPVRKGIPNLGQWLSREAGYEAVYAGKWHVPRGFTHFIPGFRVLHTGIGGQGNLGDTAVSRACEGFLRNRRDRSSGRPLLMVASFLQPHDICEWLRLNAKVPAELRYPELAPALPPLPDNFEFDPREPEYVKRSRLKREPLKGGWSRPHWRYYLWSYYRHVEMVDAEVGRVLDAVRESGREEDTLVVFTSDHGEGLAHHQMVRKSTPYDEAARVPFIVSWPGRVPEGKTDDAHPVSGLDIMPTLSDYAGARPPEKMRGVSLRGLLERGAAPARPCIVTEANSNRGRMLRTPRYKYVTYADDPVDQLFDMRDDPGETRNLAAGSSHASAVAEHRKLLREWEGRLDVAPGLPCADAWWRRG